MPTTGLITATLAGRPMAFGRTDTTPRLRDLGISDRLGEIPNTARCKVRNVTPTPGMEFVAILTGSSERIFGGLVLAVHQASIAKATDLEYDLQCIDYTWLLNRRKVTKRYTSTTAGAILTDLLATFTSGFTATAVESAAGSTAIDEITFTHEDMTDALSRLASRIGAYWYCDYVKDIHFFFSETGSNPTALTAQHPTLELLSVQPSTDHSQIVTRVTHEGQGTTTAIARQPGATTLPVLDTSPFNAAGGTVVSGVHTLTYTGIGTATEPNPESWKAQTAPSAQYTAICWGPGAGVYVAVGVGGAVITSPDGVVWTTRTASEANNWQDVCWSPSLALFVAVAAGGTNRVMTSPDGITWTNRTAAAANTWTGVCWAADLNLFVAVSLDGASRVMTSPNGTTWTSRTAAAAKSWLKIAWSPTLGLLIAVGGGGAATDNIMTSPDGTTWTSRTHTSADLWDVCWAESLGLVVISGTNVVLTSSNGTSYTLATLTNTWSSITWADDIGVLVLVARDVSITNQIATSRDGFGWTPVPTTVATTNAYYDVAWSSELGLFASCVGNAGSVYIITTTGTPLDALIGIPASGAGSIPVALQEGADINLLVTVNDTAAQAALAAAIGGDGIQEDYLQDRRLSEDEATARATAHLELHKNPEIRLRYRCRDILTKSGRTITVPGYAGSVLANTPAGYWRLGERGYSQQVMASGPVGFWRLDEPSGTVADDEVGSNNGTYTNTPTLGVVGPISDYATATRFTAASTEYVAMGDVAAFEFTSAFSVECWVKTTASGSELAIIGKMAAAGQGWRVTMLTNGKVHLLVGTSVPAFIIALTSTTAWNDGLWHHVVYTWDGTTGANGVKVYVDGVLDGQATATAGTPATNAEPFVVGAYSSAFSLPFSGDLANPAVYNRVLSAAEITAHSAARFQTDATVTAQANDSSGNARHGTYTAGPTLGAATALHDGNTGITLDGTNYVTMGDVAAFEFTGAFSVEYWFLAAANVAEYGTVSKSDAANAKGWRCTVFQGKPRFLAVTSAPATIFDLTTASAYADGRWHHVVHTWTGDTSANGVKTYVDGVLVAQAAAAAGTPASGLADAFVVGDTLTTDAFIGSLDEVAVYGAVLTPTQIATHYAQRNWVTDTLGDLTIQQVEISDFSERSPDLMPTYAVEASSMRFSFEDVLRRVPREKREAQL